MHRMLIGTALALTCSVAVPFAQQREQPQSQPQSAREAAPDAAPAHKVYVLTGCLMARDDAPSIFTLSDATAIGEAPPPAPAVASAAEQKAVGTSGGAEKGGTFELQAVSGLTSKGKDEAALKVHAGHRVEVTVRPVDVMAAAPASSTAGAAATTPEPPAEQLPPRYTVTEIKAVSGACS